MKSSLKGIQSWMLAIVPLLFLSLSAMAESVSPAAIGQQINQARSDHSQGFYRRAREQFAQIVTALETQPDSRLKVVALLNYGNVLRVIGEMDQAQKILQQGLKIAYTLQSPPEIQSAQLAMGHLMRDRKKYSAALIFYTQAATIDAPNTVPAQLAQLAMRIELGQHETAIATLPVIQSHLEQLSLSPTKVYGLMKLANYWVKIQPQQRRLAAQHLRTAAQWAHQMNDARAEAIAWGQLGALYESSQQWSEAQALTQTALNIAQSIRADDIAYQWQWQIARLRRAQQDYPGAIAHYQQAVKLLHGLRQDLTAIEPDGQFSFRDRVEPVYRELVNLLMMEPDEHHDESTPHARPVLDQALQVMESLQVAELTDFFREACLEKQPQTIAHLDPHAALIYPIVLPDRLEVILAIAGQPLKHYSTPIQEADQIAAYQQMRQSLRSTSFEPERRAIAQKLYQWLIQPAATELQRAKIQTLVFIPDEELLNLPMAALHDGNQYLIERYAIAVTPSLYLLPAPATKRPPAKAVIAGLSRAHQDLSALPGVEQEVQQIHTALPSTVLLNQAFTYHAIAQHLRDPTVSILHLASHGQFSSKASNTYIQAWNHRLDIADLRSLLDRPLDLLILSACQTAQGDDRAALGLAGMAVRSGARSILATLWSINDQSTAQFMSHFYRELARSRLSKAEMVRQAQLELLQNPTFKHPYYWAAFVLVGNWQ